MKLKFLVPGFLLSALSFMGAGPAAASEGGWSLPILCYHQLGVEKKKDAFTQSPSRFEEEIAWLKGQGYQSVSLSQVAEALAGHAEALPAKPICISLDDGFESSWSLGGPILKKYGFKAVYFLQAKEQGHKKMLSWQQIQEIEKDGFEIGSHSCFHSNLGRPEAHEDVKKYHARLREEIFESKKILEEHVGHPVEWLAYPYGAYNPFVEGLVKQAGYQYALSVTKGFNVPGQSPYRLKRILVMGPPSLKAFQHLFDFQPVPARLDGLEDGGMVQAGQKIPFTLRFAQGFMVKKFRLYLGKTAIPVSQDGEAFRGELPGDTGAGFRFLDLTMEGGKPAYEEHWLIQFFKSEWKPYYQAE